MKTGISLTIRNFRTLDKIDWPLFKGKVNVLAGPNGSGKSTIVDALAFLRMAYKLSAQSATFVHGGHSGLSSAGSLAPVYIGIGSENLRWEVEVTTYGTIDLVFQDGDVVQDIDQQKEIKKTLMGNLYHVPTLDVISFKRGRECERGGPDLPFDIVNVSLMMMNMEEDKYHFVLHAMRAAFPDLVDYFHRCYPLAIEKPEGRGRVLLQKESNALIQYLGVMIATVNTPSGGLLVVDDATSYLHPYAAWKMYQFLSAWAYEHNITILMTTHSAAVLNQMTLVPETLFFLRSLEDQDATMPVPLSDFYKKEWFAEENNASINLGRLAIGDLYLNGRLASNGGDAPHEFDSNWQ